jgi:hypothetical protein
VLLSFQNNSRLRRFERGASRSQHPPLWRENRHEPFSYPKPLGFIGASNVECEMRTSRRSVDWLRMTQVMRGGCLGLCRAAATAIIEAESMSAAGPIRPTPESERSRDNDDGLDAKYTHAMQKATTKQVKLRLVLCGTLSHDQWQIYGPEVDEGVVIGTATGYHREVSTG